MALIELNLEKPALKRSETIDEETDAAARDENAETADSIDAQSERSDREEDLSDDQSGGRLRRTARFVGIIALVIGSAMTLKKFRNRNQMPGDGVDSEI